MHGKRIDHDWRGHVIHVPQSDEGKSVESKAVGREDGDPQLVGRHRGVEDKVV